jgi:hypothetical protein
VAEIVRDGVNGRIRGEVERWPRERRHRASACSPPASTPPSTFSPPYSS